jgi:hypothetical protein
MAAKEPWWIERGLAGSHEFYALVEQMILLHSAKSSDYDGLSGKLPFSNFRTSTELGIKPSMGVLIRMQDKWSRIKNLVKEDRDAKVRDETVEDTMMDQAVYSLIWIVLHREETVNANDQKYSAAEAPAAPIGVGVRRVTE